MSLNVFFYEIYIGKVKGNVILRGWSFYIWLLYACKPMSFRLFCLAKYCGIRELNPEDYFVWASLETAIKLHYISFFALLLTFFV